jgi:hypothetical protein
LDQNQYLPFPEFNCLTSVNGSTYLPFPCLYPLANRYSSIKALNKPMNQSRKL